MNLSFRSRNGHKILAGTLPAGINVTVFPQAPPFEDDVIDLFTLGLKYTNTARFLSDLERKGSFTADDRKVTVSRSAAGLDFRFRATHDPNRHFTATLSPDDSQTFLDAVKATLDGMGEPGSGVSAAQPSIRVSEEPGRNEPCPCGSGRKYKRCCTNGTSSSSTGVLAPLEGSRDPVVREAVQFARRNPNVLTDALFWAELGQVAGSGADHERARRAFEKALEIDPVDHGSRLNLAVTFERLGKPETALEIIQQVPEQFERRSVITGNVLYSLERYEEAIPLYEDAIREEPEFDLPYLNLVDCLRETDSPLVEYWLRRGVERVPESPQLAAEFGRFLFQEQRLHELADAEWIDSLESRAGDPGMVGRRRDDPGHIVQAQVWRACAELASERTDTALQEVLDLLPAYRQVAPDCDPTLVALAAAVEVGAIDAVEDTYGLLCDHCRQHRTPGGGGLHSLKAAAWSARGEWTEAVAECERALADQPEHSNTLGLYWFALDEIGRTDEAIDVAKQLQEADAGDDFINYNLGWLCGKAGFHDEARHFYERQREVQPNFLENLENLGVTLVLCRAEAKAAEVFDEWRDLAHQVVANVEPTQDTADYLTALATKRDSTDQLLDYARANHDSSTYVLDIMEYVEAASPPIGAHIGVRPTLPSVEDVLESMRSADPARQSELLHQLERTKNGDLSAVGMKLKDEFGDWRFMPYEAQRSLLEGERRMLEGGEHDYAPEVICYAKAVEITLKEGVFDPFKKRCSMASEIEEYVEIGFQDKFKQAHTFVSYIAKRDYIELGAMVHSLRLCGGRTGKALPLLSLFKDYIREDLHLAPLLGSELLDKVAELSRARNEAAHAVSCSREEAAKVREHVFEILQELRASAGALTAA